MRIPESIRDGTDTSGPPSSGLDTSLIDLYGYGSYRKG